MLAVAIGVSLGSGCGSSDRPSSIDSIQQDAGGDTKDAGADAAGGSGGDAAVGNDVGADVDDEQPQLAPAHITIDAPADGTSIDSLSFAIHVTVKNFGIAPFGQCGSVPSCGHVRVKLDGDNCSEGSAPHNVAMTSMSGTFDEAEGSATVDTAPCRTSILGRDVSLTAELVGDDFEELAPRVIDEVLLKF
jgi:hypothetical protein